MVRPHRAPLKYIKKYPLHKILLYFFIIAPRRRGHVKKKKNVESVVAARLLLVRLLSLVLVKIKRFFFREHIVLRHQKVALQALVDSTLAPAKLKTFFFRDHLFVRDLFSRTKNDFGYLF